jgi:tetratricopeptide (TPR) repeat protein
VPKVIDFGIAKATQHRSTDKTIYAAIEQLIGTPAYMSPEQAGMSSLDIDTRSDIYSLGVLLYELLTGRTPFDPKFLVMDGLASIRRTVCEIEPPSPSTRLTTMEKGELTTTAKRRQTDPPKLVHLVRGDLDWIVMKCLEKDRTRRYETANGLAMDLKRHLNNEPVSARPPSAGYRLQKAWRRHKTAFVTAALIGVVLMIATGASVWQAVLANKRLAESEAIAKFLTEVFRSPDPARDGRTITVAESLGAAAKKLETDLAKQPARRATFQGTLGVTYHGLGLNREAIPLQEKARDYYLAASGLESRDTLAAMQSLAISYDDAGYKDEALKLREKVLEVRRRVSGPEETDTLAAMLNLAISYDEVGRQDEALKLREEVLRLCRKQLGPEHFLTFQAMHNLAKSYDDTGHYEEGLKLRGESLALNRKVNGPEHLDTLNAMNNLAISYDEVGRREEALKLREQALALYRKVRGPDHLDTIWVMKQLAISYQEAGRWDEAMALLEKAVPGDPTDTDYSLTLATWQTWFGRDADYEATRHLLVRQAEGTSQAGTAERAVKAASLRPSTDAALLTNMLQLAQRAVELGKTNSLLPWYRLSLGFAEYRNGQYAAAERSIALAEQTIGNHDDIQGIAHMFHVMALLRQNRAAEARNLFDEAKAQMPPLPKDERKPAVDGRPFDHDVLIWWLSYKEARDLIESQTPAR